ncbi:MAG: hypothetical protein ACRDPY_01005 [Streptosporangiaceae bacterium]
MNRLARAYERLQQAGGLPAVVVAVHEGFVAALTALRAHEDPDSAWFGEFVMAAALAADGRDALVFAPSMPACRSPGTGITDENAAAGAAENIARDIAALCGLAAVRLARAAGPAADPGDQAACVRAARCAQRICELLAGAGAGG